jgi:hypothetical protein
MGVEEKSKSPIGTSGGTHAVFGSLGLGLVDREIRVRPLRFLEAPVEGQRIRWLGNRRRGCQQEEQAEPGKRPTDGERSLHETLQDLVWSYDEVRCFRVFPEARVSCNRSREASLARTHQGCE